MAQPWSGKYRFRTLSGGRATLKVIAIRKLTNVPHSQLLTKVHINRDGQPDIHYRKELMDMVLRLVASEVKPSNPVENHKNGTDDIDDENSQDGSDDLYLVSYKSEGTNGTTYRCKSKMEFGRTMSDFAERGNKRYNNREYRRSRRSLY